MSDEPGTKSRTDAPAPTKAAETAVKAYLNVEEVVKIAKENGVVTATATVALP